MNVVLLELGEIETDAGTVSTCALLERFTVAPPDPAGCDNVRVQVAAAPELILFGVHASELKVVVAGTGGCTETVALTEAPLYWALIVAL